MEEIKEWLYVMDYSDASITEIPIHEDELNIDDVETFLCDKGFNMDSIYFMWTTDRITITKYEKD